MFEGGFLKAPFIILHLLAATKLLQSKLGRDGRAADPAGGLRLLGELGILVSHVWRCVSVCASLQVKLASSAKAERLTTIPAFIR